MSIIDQFEKFASAFEAAVRDDDWSRMEKYFAKDATYLNAGGPDPKIEGRNEILDYFKKDVSGFDRRFDTRVLVAITPPVADGDRLSRRWRCTYSCAGTPDLVVEGEARYLFEGGLIKELEEEPTPASIHKVEEWMRKYQDRLHA